MALITDPDSLVDDSNIDVLYATKKIQLIKAGALSDDGVTIKCVYSKLKELWKSNTTYIKYPFPMTPITDEQFEMINDWDWQDDTTRYLLRTGGWAVKDSGGTSTAEWAGIIGLGSITTSAQAYFQQGLAGAAGSAAANFQLSGQVNQAIQVYSSTGNDFRSYLKLFCRDWGNTYTQVALDDIGVTTMSYQAYRFPFSHTADPKITLSRNALSAAPFSGINVNWYTAAQQRSIGGTNYNFHVVCSANTSGDNAEDIYQRIQYLLTVNSNVSCGGTGGVQVGSTADYLMHFTGDTLYTEVYSIAPIGGTYIDNFQSDDVNRIIFVDDTGAERQFPYTAVVTLNFGDNLVNDPQSKYWVYFTNDDAGDNLARDYGTLSAIMVHTDVKSDSFARYRNSSNIVTVTADSNHGLSAGESVYISGMGGTGYNSPNIYSPYTVLSADSLSAFSYMATGDPEAYASDTAGTFINCMSEYISGVSSIQKTFEYDTNKQRGGASSGEDAPITCVALGLSAGQFVKATGTIERSTANIVALVAALERNYTNPA